MKIFLIHGNAQDTNIFNSIISDDFVTLCLPGHGDNSDKLSSYSIQSYANYLEKFIDEDCVLVGHSLGGHIALELASRLSHVKGLISIAAPLVCNETIATAFIPSDEIGVIYTENPSHQQIVSFCQKQGSSSQDTTYLIESFKKQDPLARTSLLTSFSLGFSNEHELVQNLNKPYISVVGIDDELINLQYLKSLKLENFKIVKAAHNVMLDNPKVTLEIINKLKGDLTH